MDQEAAGGQFTGASRPLHPSQPLHPDSGQRGGGLRQGPQPHNRTIPVLPAFSAQVANEGDPEGLQRLRIAVQVLLRSM